MNKLFEVREFDKITKNPDFKNDTTFRYLDEQVFNNLVEFMRKFASDVENADALDFFRLGYNRNIGDVITVKNYVGLIQMKSGYQIQVLPKISFSEGEDEGNVETKRTFLKMLLSMKEFPSKVFNDANLKVDKMNLYEILEPVKKSL